MLGLSKPLITAIAAGVLMLAAAALGLLTMREIRSMINDAAVSAKAQADAEWEAKIEKSNAETNKKIADQANAALQIQADATDRVNAASQQLEELRKRNAALPDGSSIGLSADRVRLLPD